MRSEQWSVGRGSLIVKGGRGNEKTYVKGAQWKVECVMCKTKKWKVVGSGPSKTKKEKETKKGTEKEKDTKKEEKKEEQKQEQEKEKSGRRKEEGGRRTEEGGSGHERPSTKASSSSFSLSGASISSCEHSSLWSDSASTSASASPLSS